MKKKLIVYEFAGLSGCGKSTLCNGIIESRKRKKLITRPMLRLVIGSKFRKKIYEKILLLKPSVRTFMKALNEVRKEMGPRADYGYYFLLVMYDMPWTISKVCSKTSFVFEEGFVQNITSLFHLKNIEIDDRVERIISMIKDRYDVKVILCDVDARVSLERIRHRNAKDRMNAISDDEELYRALVQKKDNIEKTAEYFAVIEKIDMSSSAEDLLLKYSDLF